MKVSWYVKKNITLNDKDLLTLGEYAQEAYRDEGYASLYWAARAQIDDWLDETCVDDCPEFLRVEIANAVVNKVKEMRRAKRG